MNNTNVGAKVGKKVESRCGIRKVKSFQLSRHAQVFRLVYLVLRLGVYEVASCLLPLGLGIEEVGERAHAVQVAVVHDAEILVGCLGAEGRGLEEAISVEQILGGLPGLDVEQAGVLLQVEAGVGYVEFGLPHFLQDGRPSSPSGTSDRA